MFMLRSSLAWFYEETFRWGLKFSRKSWFGLVHRRAKQSSLACCSSDRRSCVERKTCLRFQNGSWRLLNRKWYRSFGNPIDDDGRSSSVALIRAVVRRRARAGLQPGPARQLRFRPRQSRRDVFRNGCRGNPNGHPTAPRGPFRSRASVAQDPDRCIRREGTAGTLE